RNFGVPQTRKRTYLVSVLAKDTEIRNKVQDYFLLYNLEREQKSFEKINPIEKYLRLDYSNNIYKNEAIESTPNFTESRKKIYKNNPILAIDRLAINK